MTVIASPGKQLLDVRDERRQVAADLDLEGLDRAGAIPHEQRDGAGLLAVDEQLRRRGHHRVGDVRHRQRDARDRRADVQHRRTADQQVDVGRRVHHGGRSRRRRRRGGCERRSRLLRPRRGNEDDDDRHDKCRSGGGPSVRGAPQAARLSRVCRSHCCGSLIEEHCWFPEPVASDRRGNGKLELHYLTTSCARLSPRITSTVGTGSGTGIAWVTGAADRALRGRADEATDRARRGGASHADERRGLDARRLGRALIERVAQRQLNLAFGARQRQALGLLGVDQQRHDRHLHRLALLLVLLHARAGGEHLHVREDQLRGRVGVRIVRARGRDDVDARAGQDVAGDADDFVDAHRHRAHALGNDRRQPGARFLRRELRRQDRLVLDHRARSARGRRGRSACEKVPSGACPAGKLTTVRSSFFSSAPSCRSAAATTTGWVAIAAVCAGWFCTRL